MMKRGGSGSNPDGTDDGITEDNIIAVTGGNLVPKVNGKDLPMYLGGLVT